MAHKWQICVPPGDRKARGALARPLVVEDHGDGTFTVWTFTPAGPQGERGRPRDGTIMREPRTKAELAEVARYELLMRRGIELAERVARESERRKRFTEDELRRSQRR